MCSKIRIHRIILYTQSQSTHKNNLIEVCKQQNMYMKTKKPVWKKAAETHKVTRWIEIANSIRNVWVRMSACDEMKWISQKWKKTKAAAQTTQSFKWYVRVLNWSTGSRSRSRSLFVCVYFMRWDSMRIKIVCRSRSDFLFSVAQFWIIHSFWNSPNFKMVDVRRARQ